MAIKLSTVALWITSVARTRNGTFVIVMRIKLVKMRNGLPVCLRNIVQVYRGFLKKISKPFPVDVAMLHERRVGIHHFREPVAVEHPENVA